MTKYRIKQVGDAYQVQMRFLFFWATLCDAYDLPMEFDTLEAAEKWVEADRSYTNKVVKEM